MEDGGTERIIYAVDEKKTRRGGNHTTEVGEKYFTFSVKLVYLHRDSDPIKAINIAP